MKVLSSFSSVAIDSKFGRVRAIRPHIPAVCQIRGLAAGVEGG
jgi:hypothetical protein